MAVTDASYMLRDGTIALNSTETGDGVKVGACPLGGMLVGIYRPSAGSSFTIKFSESDDDSSYTDLLSPASQSITTAGMDLYRIFWEKEYIRHQVTACTGTFGNVEIGLAIGGKPD